MVSPFAPISIAFFLAQLYFTFEKICNDRWLMAMVQVNQTMNIKCIASYKHTQTISFMHDIQSRSSVRFCSDVHSFDVIVLAPSLVRSLLLWWWWWWWWWLYGHKSWVESVLSKQQLITRAICRQCSMFVSCALTFSASLWKYKSSSHWHLIIMNKSFIHLHVWPRCYSLVHYYYYCFVLLLLLLLYSKSNPDWPWNIGSYATPDDDDDDSNLRNHCCSTTTTLLLSISMTILLYFITFPHKRDVTKWNEMYLPLQPIVWNCHYRTKSVFFYTQCVYWSNLLNIIDQQVICRDYIRWRI